MHRLLLVEDNDMNRDMLSRRLTRKGYTVECAVDGQAGIDQALAMKPDVIILDMSLPIKDGWTVAAELKATEVDWPVRIIALTAHVMEGDRERAMNAGCDDYETKPVDLKRLLGKIETLMHSIS